MMAPLRLRLGLVGYPLAHSLSPVLHEAAMQVCGLDGCYELLQVEPGDLRKLESLVSGVRDGTFHGLNITIPHKQNILQFVDRFTIPARAVGAVNTLWLENGELVGHNTDAPGFLADLERLQINQPTEALVLGAGGAARGVVYALQSVGWHVSLAARRIEQSKAMQKDFPGINILPLTRAGLATWNPGSATLIINATSAGMAPQMGINPWPDKLPFPAKAFVYDLVYNPPDTALLVAARQAGLNGCNGLGMLVEQAALAFEAWAASLGIKTSAALRLAMRQAVGLE